MKRIVSLCVLSILNLSAKNIHDHGYWEGTDVVLEHAYDPYLANAIANFLFINQATSIVDLGCGLGQYTRLLNQKGFFCKGYDGNPETFNLTNGACNVLDLSQKIDLNEQFDWVLSLEVGEHIPCEYEHVFLKNCANHAKEGIILSWALPGQGGYGHFNEKPNNYIKNKMALLGFVNDIEAENQLRLHSSLWWFKNTIMVFRKAK